MSARLLVQALRDPTSLRPDWDWTALIAAARAEQLVGSLACRLESHEVPARIGRLLAMHRADAERVRVQALWEAEMARRALAPLRVPVVLLKGTAFHAAGLKAAEGRNVGDLDILVPRHALGDVEQALIAHGWERMKETDGYDDLYYRQWMHELPPLIHRDRDRIADVHHTILPPTAGPKPLPNDLLDKAVTLADGLSVLSPEHMVVHAAAHLIADGDMAGGLRNLWDIDRLCRQFAAQQEDFYLSLAEEASAHGLYKQTMLALRLCRDLYATPVIAYDGPARVNYEPQRTDRLFKRRLLARNGWGQPTRRFTRFSFYVRGHLMRMPPLMLARHLVTKARAKPAQSVSSAPISSE